MTIEPNIRRGERVLLKTRNSARPPEPFLKTI
jgi:hypothetical protein